MLFNYLLQERIYYKFKELSNIESTFKKNLLYAEE